MLSMPMATDPATHLQGVENIQQDGDAEPQRGRGSTRSNKLSAPLRIPKNRSTGNLAVVSEFPERPRLRFSFDAGSGVAESDQITRYVMPKPENRDGERELGWAYGHTGTTGKDGLHVYTTFIMSHACVRVCVCSAALSLHTEESPGVETEKEKGKPHSLNTKTRFKSLATNIFWLSQKQQISHNHRT